MKAEDLRSPQQYEVIKLKIGTEIVAMTRSISGGLVELTLPMCYTLTPIGDGTSRTTFYPFAPTSADTNITISVDDIMYRSEVGEQFIPLYDRASSSWAYMLEKGTIPISSGLSSSPTLQRMYELLEDYSYASEEYEDYNDDDFFDSIDKPKTIH